MTTSTIKVKVVRRPSLKLKVLPRFPANVTVTAPITLDRTGGNYGFGLDASKIGNLPASSLPNPTASTLGGVQSAAAAAHNWINSISTLGIPTFSQPAFTDVSGQATLAQLPTLAANTILGSIAGGTPIALSKTQTTTLVNTFTTALSGAVPSPGSVTNKFLRDDGTWQAPTGSGTVTNIATAGLASGGAITTTGTITVTAAVKSDQQTGTSNVLAVTPGIQQQHDSAAKAWVCFTGSAVNGAQTIQSSYNVTSVVRNSQGSYTVTFTTAFAAATYVCNVNSEVASGSTTGLISQVVNGTRTTTAVTLQFLVVAGTAGADPVSGFLTCHGRQ